METSWMTCKGYSWVSSYRTYEEWKQKNSPANTGAILFVLTVPMRNGNSLSKHNGGDGMFWFLPYLWGMETASRWVLDWSCIVFLPYLWGMETLRCTKGFISDYFVLTVPMRNGNLHIRIKDWKKARVLTVPMRNGNTIMGSTYPNASIRSYRTYEEWKLLNLVLAVVQVIHRSYRTYEEWKPEKSGRMKPQEFSFLPYLWGMETWNRAEWFSFVFFRSYRTYEEWKQKSVSP